MSEVHVAIIGCGRVSGHHCRSIRDIVQQLLAGLERFGPGIQWLRQYGLISYCVVPLTTPHRRLGALGFGRKLGHGFTAHDLEFLGRVAQLVAFCADPALDQATLADGTTCVFQVYTGKVTWDGKVRTILVDEADTDPLVGMRLLRGHELKMQVRARGKVTIKRMPRR